MPCPVPVTFAVQTSFRFRIDTLPDQKGVQMHRVLLASFCVLAIAGFAFAQPPGNLGVYADPAGTVCSLYDITPGLIQYYVVHNLTPAAQAASFKAPVPTCMTGAVFISDETMWPIKIGLVTDGTTVGYGGCKSAPIHVLTINIFAQGMTGECCPYPVIPHPSSVTGDIEIEGCDGVWYAATGVASVINATPACLCEVSTETTTWGKIKALYTQ
jgi:hypothetical protein